ncbi:Dot/Icm T4SS effector AnkK/LegA5 [Legionella dresdenensis]|uniref:Dot/Icm T4SS effector AnkK/LegA5 n=1 Tax=Legionella dresdenensis TaxID=450200 RepID=A0ABV8CFS4_9GAMM
MSFIIDVKQIDLGSSIITGHEVYPNASLLVNNQRKKVIYKLNKNGKPVLSYMEVAFTGLARLFLRPNLTSPQYLAGNKLDDNSHSVEGVICDNICYAIEQRENSNVFYLAHCEDNKLGFDDGIRPTNPEQIPYRFFHQYPRGFFAKLCQARDEGKLAFDLDSLASVLTTAYTLEEDDFHKGNFGFYIVEDRNKEGQPIKKVVFFKIDHDLMMCDSLISRIGSRLVNIIFGSHAFDITKRDIKKNPLLIDSQNHYWPTRKRYLATTSSSNRIYKDDSDINAFIKIRKDKDFIEKKWLNLYKHILIPQTLIIDSLQNAYTEETAEGRAQVALITEAVLARQARLRAVLFSTRQFREFVRILSNNEKSAIVNEIVNSASQSISQEQKEQITRQIKRTMESHYASDNRDSLISSVVKHDTPLHIAIRNGDFRFDDTWHSFGKFAEDKNIQHQTALDIAVEKLNKDIKNLSKEQVNNNFKKIWRDDDVGNNPVMIIRFLLRQGVHETKSYRELPQAIKQQIECYSLPSQHATNAGNARTTQELINAIRNIGEDQRYCLKMKKEIAALCVKQFITDNKDKADFKQILKGFKNALNERKPELQFIHQLRSKLWIVRQIRGLFGYTSTLGEINKSIDSGIRSVSLAKNRSSLFNLCSKGENSRTEKKSASVALPIPI